MKLEFETHSLSSEISNQIEKKPKVEKKTLKNSYLCTRKSNSTKIEHNT